MFDSIKLTKERKIILIGGAILLIIGAIYRFSPSMLSAVSVSDEIAMKKNHVEKYIKVVAQKKRAEKEKEYFKRLFKQTESRLLTGETRSLAAVEIQNILNKIAGAGNVKFMTMRVMKPMEGENAGYVRLPVQFSMNSDINQLKKIIYQIEASAKLLIITGLDSKMTRSRDQQLIRSTITVEGVMKALRAEG